MLEWEDVLRFPVNYCDLCVNSTVVLTAFAPTGEPIGGTSMRLFDRLGLLKTGLQKLVFYIGPPGSTLLQSPAVG